MDLQFKIVDETDIYSNSGRFSQKSGSDKGCDTQKASTPLNSQQTSFLPSQTLSDVRSPLPEKNRPSKYTKKDALELLKKMGDKIETVNRIFMELAGTTFEDCSQEDANDLEAASVNLR